MIFTITKLIGYSFRAQVSLYLYNINDSGLIEARILIKIMKNI